MEELEAFEALIDDVLFVDVFQYICPDDRVQVGVHEVENKVDVAIVLSPNHILEPDNVLVASKFLEEDNLTESPLSIRGVLEGVEVLLESDNLLGSLVNGLPHNSVSSLAEFLENLVFLEHMSFNLFSHFELSIYNYSA